jgi:hypothetical protein
MTHLTSDELVDAVDESLSSERLRHLEHCSPCLEQLTRLRARLREVESVPVPEPSPLFWTHFSQRVRDAIASEATPKTSWVVSWVRWPVLAPAAALALAVFALVTMLPGDEAQPPPTPVATVQDPVHDLTGLGDQEWALLTDMVGPVDLEAVQDAGFVQLGDAERAALQLSATEQRELLRLLQEEMDKSGG